MLEKPAVADEKIIACLQAAYGLRITQFDFLPLGGNLCTAVYRAVSEDGIPYFCKLRCSDFREISVELPKYLSDQGIAEVIPPLITLTGPLWTDLDEYRLILYPFIEGKSGFDVELTEPQWAAFGTALQRIHQTDLPPALRHKIPSEDFSTESREMVREALQRLAHETFTDPIMQGLADFLLPRREAVLGLIERAGKYAHRLAARQLAADSPAWVLCHNDIHPGNLFIDTQGTLFIVDWDGPVLAPKERDLIFIGGGQGYVARTSQEEETLFYRYYGLTPVDPLAMAYYRCERNLYDLSVECPRILSTTLNARDRAQSLQIVTWLFLPDGSVELAYKAADRVQ